MGADPDIMRDLPNQVYEHPINGLKMMRDRLEKRGMSLSSSGKGLEAHEYFERAKGVQQQLDDMVNSLPDAMKQQYQHAQSLFARARAMEDINAVFGKNMKGLELDKQAKNTLINSSKAARLPTINASGLIEALKENPRLSQAFGPDVASAIIERADRMGVAQTIRGSGSTGIGGALLGTGMLLGAFRAFVEPFYATTIPAELGGIWALSKVLADPQASSFYANMLRAGSQAQQLFWAQRAVQTALAAHPLTSAGMTKKGQQQSSHRLPQPTRQRGPR